MSTQQGSGPRLALGEQDRRHQGTHVQALAGIPKRAVVALTAHKARQAKERRAAGSAWQDNDLVFCHENGAPYTSDQLNWRFSKMTRRAGIGRWHAHEGRRTAVSIMSSNGVPIQGWIRRSRML